MASHVRTTIRYDGPALAEHEIDIQELAPALLALADVIQLANKKFNGDAAAMRVTVKADVEQRCFQIYIHLAQTLLEQARGLFTEENLKTAGEIAKAVGLVGTGAASLFKLIKFFGKKTEKPTTEFQVRAGKGSTVIIVNGDGNSITVPEEVYALASDKAVMEKAKAVLRPLERAGYEELSFVQDDKSVVTLTKDEAVRVKDAPALQAAPVPTEVRYKITGPVRIKTPQYEGSAKWTVLSGGRPIDVSMPPDWLEDFQRNRIDAPPNSILDVEMEQVSSVGPDGIAIGNPTYTVTNIRGVTLPERQGRQSEFGVYWAEAEDDEEPPITA